MSDTQKSKKPLGSSLSRDEKIDRLRALRKKDINTVIKIAPVKPAPEIGEVMEDGTVYAGISPDTNKPMFARPADEWRMDFNQAAQRAGKLSAETGKSYRIPSGNELNVLFNNRAAIGGFKNGLSEPSCWYWSSTSISGCFAYRMVQQFSNGIRTSNIESVVLRARLERS